VTVATPTCPRCRSPVREPGLWSAQWQCPSHGAVAPLHVLGVLGEEQLGRVAERCAVPVWVPAPPPRGWLVTGAGWAGDERTGARASVVALSGPSPLGGPADLLLVAEEPGVGLGASFAGVPGPDPGSVGGRPEGKVEIGGHPTALWAVGGAADRCALAGEAEGVWIWAVLWPAEADLVLLEHFALRDLRGEVPPVLGYGALTPRLLALPAAAP